MININFDQNGGFPLTQDKLSLMQESYTTVQEALLAMIPDDLEDFLILSGVEKQTDGSYSSGIIKWGDNICRFAGSSSDVNVAMTEENLSDTFHDNINKIYASRKDIRQTSGVGLKISEIQRYARSIKNEKVYPLETWQGTEQQLRSVRSDRIVNITGKVVMYATGVATPNHDFALDVEFRPTKFIFFSTNSIDFVIIPDGRILPNETLPDSGNYYHINVSFII